MGNKHLAKVISYKNDIEPYNFIRIYAGVGSGKNFYINKLITGYTETLPDGTEYTVKPQRVLCITSRRAKVNEIQNDESVSVGQYIGEWDNWNAIDDLDEYLKWEKELPDIGCWITPSISQRSVACTNAAIEKYLQNKYSPHSVETHLWHRFDIIVVDEIHSISADASYQSAPFYIHKLINKVIRLYRKGQTTCKIIVMTGSPHIIENFSIPKEGNHIDLMERCINIVPKRLTFVDSNEARKDVKRRLCNGERLIYFANHIDTIFKIYEDMPEELRETIAFSFSAEDRLDLEKKEHQRLYERMKDTEDEIAKSQKIPDTIKLLLTTSKNKEGINIKNEDVDTMYIEAHAEVDIIQMAGRVRNSVEDLYIITDSKGFGDNESQFEYDFTQDSEIVDRVNDFFRKLCIQENVVLDPEFDCIRKNIFAYSRLKDFIEYIHKKYPYVRFNYFEDEFQLYSHRHSSITYYKEQHELFARAVGNQDMLSRLAKRWFPTTEVCWPETLQEQVDRYIAEHGYIGASISPEEEKRIIEDLNEIEGKKYKRISKLINPFGYKRKLLSQNKDATTYGMITIKKK